MGSGSSKKKEQTNQNKDTKEQNPRTVQSSKPGQPNEKNQTQTKTEEKGVLVEKPENPEKQAAIATATKNVEASNARKLAKHQLAVDHWQDADLSELMGGLELSNDPHVWEEYVDALVTRNKQDINPDTEVRENLHIVKENFPAK